MKKAIVLNTSPRKGGNCDLVSQRVADRLMALGMEVQRVDFRSVEFNYCRGCDACKAKDEPWCVQNDEWANMIPAVENCDAMVILTPIYFGDITAQAKTVLDRFYPWFNPRFETMSLTKKTGKKLAVLTTCGGSSIEDCEAAATKMANPLAIAGFTDSRVLAVNDVNMPGSAMENLEYLDVVDDLVDWLSE